MSKEIDFDEILGKYRSDPFDYIDVCAIHTGVVTFKVKEGDEVFANTDDGGLRITPYDPEFELTMQAFERGRKKYKDALRQLAK